MIKKKFIVCLLASLVLFGFTAKESLAQENLSGNDFIEQAELKDMDDQPLRELVTGMPAKLSYTLNVPNSASFSAGERITVELPEELRALYHNQQVVYQQGKEIGKLTEVLTGSKSIDIEFTEPVISGEKLTIDDLFVVIPENTKTAEQKIVFGHNISQKLTILPASQGIAGLVDGVQARGISQWENDVASWELDMGVLGNHFYALQNKQDLKKRNPNYEGTIIEKVYPYHFFGKNEQGLFLDDMIARCLDMNHTLSLTNSPAYIDLTYYIEEEAVEDIVLHSQVAYLLAKESGLIVDTQNGTTKPFHFSSNVQDAYDQRAYLFTAQMMGWVNALKYNKFTKAKMPNFDYSDLKIMGRKSYSDTYKSVDLKDYIQTIEDTTNLFKQTDYLSNKQLSYTSEDEVFTIDIPKEQQRFRHSINRQESKNLHLVSGISESDFDHFDALTIQPNENFNGEKVEIVIEKNFYDATSIQNTGMSEDNVQYKHIIGMSDQYIEKSTLSLDMAIPKEVTVKKVWQDQSNQDGIRPTHIAVQLYANNQALGEKVVLHENNQWSHVWHDLAEKINGEIVEYTVKEVETTTGYTLSTNKDASGTIILTNSHTPERTEISGEKVWDDQENQDGVRPESVAINLLADGVVVDSQVVDATSKWAYTFTNLPKYKNGQKIVYTVTENSVPNYSTEICGTTITNHYTPEQTSVSVTKSWNDENNQDGIRPKNIQVQLYADNETYGEEITLNEDNQWSHTWANLPEKADGKPIHYTVEETSTVNEYDAVINDGDRGNILLTNTHVPEVIDLSGEKIWEDQENQDGIRPESVTINLLANGSIVGTEVVSATSNWTYSFMNLPKYKNGQEIVYTVTENSVPNYSTEIDGTTITNYYTPGKTSVSVTKAWNDHQNEFDSRPKEIEVQLYADEQSYGEKITLSEQNDWTYTWTDLDEKIDGTAVTYSIKEITDIAGYDTSINEDDWGNVVVTNTYILDESNPPNEPAKEGPHNSLPETGESQHRLFVVVGLFLMMPLAAYWLLTYFKQKS